MEKFNYYEAPPQEIFEEIKSKAIEIWQTYDNTYGYVDEKVNRIKDIKNVKDNAWYMIAMFDMHNIRRLYNMVNEQTKAKIKEMLIETETINFLQDLI